MAHSSTSRSQGLSSEAPVSLRRRAFTLTELMVAVLVLVIVIIGTAKIFGTASQITAKGMAGASVMAEAAAFEQQLRQDIASLTNEGFFAIHCVAVRNDINQVLSGGPLLNPNLPPNASIRADQLVFFTKGLHSIQTLRTGPMIFDNHKGLGAAARIYYGHAFQLPDAPGVQPGGNNAVRAIDPPFPTPPNPNLFYDQLSPWAYGQVDLFQYLFQDDIDTAEYSAVGGPFIAQFPVRPPPATQWLLARQAVVMATDDDGSSAAEQYVYLDQNRSAATIIAPVIRNGRVDMAAEELSSLRQSITLLNQSTGVPRPWDDGSLASPADQRHLIREKFFYPRAERRAPSMHRVDQALTNSVIATACSSFIVEWTYEDRAGEAVDANGNVIQGFRLDPRRDQPWFGLTDFTRGVGNYSDPNYQFAAGYTLANTIPIGAPPANFPNNIEMSTVGLPVDGNGDPLILDYWATFGYNQTAPFFNTSAEYDPPGPMTGSPHPTTGVIDPQAGFTPWPSAIRITMTLHDPEGKLDTGREFQFIVNLPKFGR